MRKQFFLLSCMAVILMGCPACSDDDSDDRAAKVSASAKGVWTDSRDGQEYGWVRYGKQEWMTENFRYDLGNEELCTIYLDADEYETNPEGTRNLAKYGRLYTLKGAEDACPDGWRVPADKDWQQLEQLLGMSAADANRNDWRGNIAHNMFSIKDDVCDLNLLLGGYYTENINMGRSPWRFMGVFAYYWTSSMDNNKEGEFYFCRKLTYNRNSVCRMSIDPKHVKLSVRYVRDVE